jgi:hypothetical protein
MLGFTFVLARALRLMLGLQAAPNDSNLLSTACDKGTTPANLNANAYRHQSALLRRKGPS